MHLSAVCHPDKTKTIWVETSAPRSVCVGAVGLNNLSRSRVFIVHQLYSSEISDGGGSVTQNTRPAVPEDWIHDLLKDSETRFLTSYLNCPFNKIDSEVINYWNISSDSNENIYHKPVRRREPFSEAGEHKLLLFFRLFTPSADLHVYVETAVLVRWIRWSRENKGRKCLMHEHRLSWKTSNFVKLTYIHTYIYVSESIFV